jgi:predicted PurR-regulated permease PerM
VKPATHPPVETPGLPAAAATQPLSQVGATGVERAPAWLRTAAAVMWRAIVVVVGIIGIVYLLGVLRVVVLPVIVALLATTLLLPPARWLQQRGLPPSLAAGLTMLASVLVLSGLAAAVAPSIGGQLDELGTGVQDGVRDASGVLADPPFNLSERQVRERVDEGIDRIRENSGPLTRGAQRGAILLGEVITGLILTVLLTFFFLSDGPRMWRWVVALVGDRRRADTEELGRRVFTALSGYVRGIALVGLADAVLIGIALLLIGVPLVVPLMLLTFFAAFLPLIGAFLAGLAAVLIALVSNGPVPALLVLGAIVLVQQIEGHLLYPLLMSRTVHLHPAVILIALGIGGILGGVVGVFLAVPTAGVIAVVLDFARNRPPPQSPVADPASATTV